jgi:protein phosphatase 2C
MHRFHVAKVESIGGRANMEDYSFATRVRRPDNASYAFGVFDGHNGGGVASESNRRLATEILEITQHAATSTRAFDSALRRAFRDLDDALALECEPDVGTTATVVADVRIATPLLSANFLAVANVGDSRAIVVRDLHAMPYVEQLTVDHRPTLKEELERIAAAGGVVTYGDCPRVMGSLNVSRTLGDWYLRPYVSPIPHVQFARPLGRDDALVLASDGLWDALDNSQVGLIVARALLSNRRDPQQAVVDAAVALEEACRQAGSTDNATILVAAAATSTG